MKQFETSSSKSYLDDPLPFIAISGPSVAGQPLDGVRGLGQGPCPDMTRLGDLEKQSNVVGQPMRDDSCPVDLDVDVRRRGANIEMDSA